MKTEPVVNYQGLNFFEQRKLDQKAYAKYFNEYFDREVLSFNSWYGTKQHQKYINILLRKYKLNKLNEIS